MEDCSDESSSESADDSDSEMQSCIKPSSSSVKRCNPAPSVSRPPAKKQRSTADPKTVYPVSSYEMMDECVPLEADKDADNWSDKRALKWHKLRHNGVVFPPAYTPHG
eukprot:402975_1